MPAQRTFHYHANAHVFSGRFTRPIQHVIEVQAATSLPIIGGVSSARVENFRFNEHVSFKSGYSHVSGSEKSEKSEKDDKVIHTTLATAAIEDLNILDVVTADRIVARLSSSYDPADEESRILVIGGRFENLRIAGHKVEGELHHQLAQKPEPFEGGRKKVPRKRDFTKIG